MEKFKIILAPSLEDALTVEAEATIEAEYGDHCVQGSQLTLAHHGSRSYNPAPCITEIEPLQSGTLLVSHIDLDTIGGCLAIMGEKTKDDNFWEGAAFIDVNGAHHIHSLDQDVQKKLNAYYNWNYQQERVRYSEITDVTKKIHETKEILDIILDSKHPEHQEYIDNGVKWEKEVRDAVESKLYEDGKNIRSFVTDGVFCASSYYSPKDKEIKDATITLNEKFNAITVAFADGGEKHSAKEFVQELWGDKAGGRDGIAGSPRNWDKSPQDVKLEFYRAISELEKTLSREDLTKERTSIER